LGSRARRGVRAFEGDCRSPWPLVAREALAVKARELARAAAPADGIGARVTRFVALLRGINVGGNTRVPMAELRALCGQIGWTEVATYIQSGNVLFRAAGRATEHELELEEGIRERFALEVPVIVRAGSDWPALVAGNPFEEAARTEPNRLMLCLSKEPPAPDAEHDLQERAKDGERVRLVGEALWIHYPAGSGTSKLSPSLINRLVGSPVTSRNWRTAVQLQQMLVE